MALKVIIRFLRSLTGRAGLSLLLVLGAVAIFGPMISPHHYATTNFDLPFQTIGTSGYLLGTDELGRDTLTRLMYGTRTSLQTGLIAVAVGVVIGTPLGLWAGYSRPADVVIARLTDVALAFPFLIIAVGLATLQGPSLENAAIALGIANIPIIIRVMRGEGIRIRNESYISAAIATNASQLHIIFRHVLPNASSALIIQATILVPVAIIGEAMLSFLGLGIQPPESSLGIMLSDAQQYMYRSPFASVYPGVVIALLCISFNFMGDALRDALDPKSRLRTKARRETSK